ncbi:hypothetical protein ONE63_007286 [Megalurothrips usitatus]|uniref:Acyltransferase n=1 Tax=Megalurothrips usitatus TaxID=439358 RepID=A0AAV7XRJ4_9NEOP|nr:hypothetical protein ONE63_007286 [Megalurothrips usitatus]
MLEAIAVAALWSFFVVDITLEIIFYSFALLTVSLWLVLRQVAPWLFWDHLTLSFCILLGVVVPWLYWDRHTPSRGGRRKWLQKPMRLLCRRIQSYFPLQIVKAKGARLPTTKNYILDIHPHGFCMAAAAAALFSGGLQSAFPGIDFKTVVLDLTFLTLPFVREVSMGIGCISQKEESIRHVLQSRAGGKAVVLFSGGIQEVFHMRPDAFRLRLKQRGFCRVALLEGAQLVPALMLGENLSYRQPLLQVMDWLYKQIGVRIPLFFGRGLFVKHIGMLPHRVPHTFVVGAALDVRKTPDPTHEEVEALHFRYVKAVRNLYKECGPQFNAASLPLVIST